MYTPRDDRLCEIKAASGSRSGLNWDLLSAPLSPRIDTSYERERHRLKADMSPLNCPCICKSLPTRPSTISIFVNRTSALDTPVFAHFPPLYPSFNILTSLVACPFHLTKACLSPLCIPATASSTARQVFQTTYLYALDPDSLPRQRPKQCRHSKAVGAPTMSFMSRVAPLWAWAVSSAMVGGISMW